MSDKDFMTVQEMREHFPGPSYRKLELVVLVDGNGEGMWARESDGWHRLEDKLHGS